MLGGETPKAVAERFGLSAGHVRRLTAEARQAAQGGPQRPLRVVQPDETEPLPEPDAEPEALPGTTDATGWPVGSRPLTPAATPTPNPRRPTCSASPTATK